MTIHSLESLDYHALEKVVDYLSESDRAQMRLVSSDLKEKIDSEEVWRYLCGSRFNTTGKPDHFRTWEESYKHLYKMEHLPYYRSYWNDFNAASDLSERVCSVVSKKSATIPSCLLGVIVPSVVIGTLQHASGLTDLKTSIAGNVINIAYNGWAGRSTLMKVQMVTFAVFFASGLYGMYTHSFDGEELMFKSLFANTIVSSIAISYEKISAVTSMIGEKIGNTSVVKNFFGSLCANTKYYVRKINPLNRGT